VRHDRPARGLGVLEPGLHPFQAVTVVDRGQDPRVPSQQGLVLQLEVLGERDEDALRDGYGVQAAPRLDVHLDRRERGRIDRVRHV
jgi:hypothetical protein